MKRGSCRNFRASELRKRATDCIVEVYYCRSDMVRMQGRRRVLLFMHLALSRVSGVSWSGVSFCGHEISWRIIRGRAQNRLSCRCLFVSMKASAAAHLRVGCQVTPCFCCDCCAKILLPHVQRHNTCCTAYAILSCCFWCHSPHPGQLLPLWLPQRQCTTKRH